MENKKEIIEGLKAALQAWETMKNEDFKIYSELLTYSLHHRTSAGFCSWLRHNNFYMGSKYIMNIVGSDQFVYRTIWGCETLAQANESINFRIGWVNSEIKKLEEMP